jgi:hypothetical protein
MASSSAKRRRATEVLDKRHYIEIKELDHIRESVKCPVCLGVYHEPVHYGCPEGHRMCKECFSELLLARGDAGLLKNINFVLDCPCCRANCGLQIPVIDRTLAAAADAVFRLVASQDERSSRTQCVERIKNKLSTLVIRGDERILLRPLVEESAIVVAFRHHSDYQHSLAKVTHSLGIRIGFETGGNSIMVYSIMDVGRQDMILEYLGVAIMDDAQDDNSSFYKLRANTLALPTRVEKAIAVFDRMNFESESARILRSLFDYSLKFSQETQTILERMRLMGAEDAVIPLTPSNENTLQGKQAFRHLCVFMHLFCNDRLNPAPLKHGLISTCQTACFHASMEDFSSWIISLIQVTKCVHDQLQIIWSNQRN